MSINDLLYSDFEYNFVAKSFWLIALLFNRTRESVE